jgi:processing peptidase subunit beta
VCDDQADASLMNVDDMVHFTLREWTRMSQAPSIGEVERAKSQLKASLLLGLDGTTAIAEDVRGCLCFGGELLTMTDWQTNDYHWKAIHTKRD